MFRMCDFLTLRRVGIRISAPFHYLRAEKMRRFKRVQTDKKF